LGRKSVPVKIAVRVERASAAIETPVAIMSIAQARLGPESRSRSPSVEKTFMLFQRPDHSFALAVEAEPSSRANTAVERTIKPAKSEIESGCCEPGSMRAPPESMNHTIGQRPRSAI
jgi:hypothetical protein